MTALKDSIEVASVFDSCPSPFNVQALFKRSTVSNAHTHCGSCCDAMRGRRVEGNIHFDIWSWKVFSMNRSYVWWRWYRKWELFIWWMFRNDVHERKMWFLHIRIWLLLSDFPAREKKRSIPIGISLKRPNVEYEHHFTVTCSTRTKPNAIQTCTKVRIERQMSSKTVIVFHFERKSWANRKSTQHFEFKCFSVLNFHLFHLKLQ